MGGSGPELEGEMRVGEAKNPGPGSGAEGTEGEFTVEALAERAEVQEQRAWAPAWQSWAKQVVRPSRDGKGITIDLVPPLVVSEEAEHARMGRGEWEEDELEAFLQQCEVEAGLRQEVDRDEARYVSECWRSWEAEVTMAGITCPSTDERCGAAEEGGRSRRRRSGGKFSPASLWPAPGGEPRWRQTQE